MADLVLYELGRPGVVASPNGCAACGWPERGHPIWYVDPHMKPGVPKTYVQPDDATRLARMRARRRARVLSFPTHPRRPGGPVSQPTDYTAKLYLQATEAIPGIVTAAGALDFTVRPDAACYDLVTGPVAEALTKAGASCCLEDQLGLAMMMLAEVTRRYTDLRNRIEADQLDFRSQADPHAGSTQGRKG